MVGETLEVRSRWLIARLHRAGRGLHRVARHATWGQRLVLLLFAGMAASVACLLPGALREDAMGLAFMLTLFVMVAGLGAYWMARSLIDEPDLIIPERPLPRAFWTLSRRLQATIAAARHVELTARDPRTMVVDLQYEMRRWESTIRRVDQEDSSFLHGMGVDVDDLMAMLREVTSRGSREECLVMARDFEERVLGGPLLDPMRRGG